VPTYLFLRKFPSFSLLFSVGTGNKKDGQVWVQEMPDHSNWVRARAGLPGHFLGTGLKTKCLIYSYKKQILAPGP